MVDLFEEIPVDFLRIKERTVYLTILFRPLLGDKTIKVLLSYPDAHALYLALSRIFSATLRNQTSGVRARSPSLANL